MNFGQAKDTFTTLKLSKYLHNASLHLQKKETIYFLQRSYWDHLWLQLKKELSRHSRDHV